MKSCYRTKYTNPESLKQTKPSLLDLHLVLLGQHEEWWALKNFTLSLWYTFKFYIYIYILLFISISWAAWPKMAHERCHLWRRLNPDCTCAHRALEWNWGQEWHGMDGWIKRTGASSVSSLTHSLFSLLCREMKALWGLTSRTDAVHKELRTTPHLLFPWRQEEHSISFLKIKLHHSISFSPRTLFEIFYIQGQTSIRNSQRVSWKEAQKMGTTG